MPKPTESPKKWLLSLLLAGFFALGLWTMGFAPNRQNEFRGLGNSPSGVPKGFYDDRDVSFTHIPKCSGTSFFAEIEPEYSRQDCYLHFKRAHPETMQAVMLRSPINHVYSQFLECTYDRYGIRTTKGTDFPRTGDITGDLEKWLEHFVGLNDGDIGPEHDYGCMDPRNVQTRHMSCEEAPNPMANHFLEPPPNIAVALKNLNDADFVGLTDFYHESLCLLKLRRTGNLPEGCICGMGREKVTHIRQSHGVPQKRPGISNGARLNMEKVTDLDRLLFVEALKRFQRDIAVAERVVGEKILCNTTKATEILMEFSSATS